MILKLLILLTILYGCTYSYPFPSFRKILVHEFTDLGEGTGSLDLTGWNQSSQYTCGTKNILGKFSYNTLVQKTYENLPVHDYVEISMHHYVLDSPDYNGNINGDDILIFRINNNQEEIQRGRWDLGFITRGELVEPLGNICAPYNFAIDSIILKKFEQFSYQSTTLDISFRTKFDQDVEDESWGVRQINVKLYRIENLQNVHSLDDLSGSTVDTNGWSLPTKYQCGSNEILGRFELTNAPFKIYSNIPEYRFVTLNAKFYLLDTIDYMERDEFFTDLNDIEELVIIGKNFETSADFGSGNICNWTYNDLIITESIGQFTTPKTEFKLSFRTSYTGGGAGEEAWGVRDLEMEFYNYTPTCVPPFVLTTDKTWCVCPEKYQINAAQDDCECAYAPGALTNFDSSTCDCTGEFVFLTDTCICPLSITNYFNSSTCQCDNTFVFNADKSQCVCPPNQVILSGTCQNCPSGQYFNNNSCLPCDNSTCATCSSTSISCILSCNSDCLSCSPDQLCLTCNSGNYLEINRTCQACDNTVCATCNTTPTTCDISCNSDCKSCDTTGSCISCDDGKYLNNGQCLPCDNSTCATCNNQANQCVLSCNSDCKTCSVDQKCLTCNDRDYLETDKTCQSCDNTVCATCNTNPTTCDISCYSDCKECDTTGSCVSCEDGKYLNNGSCLLCDNSTCATCSSTSISCILNCNSYCKTCSIDQKCLTCNDGSYLETDKTCQACDNTVCATCNTNPTTCDISCNSDCKECDTTGSCTLCADGKYLNNGSCLPCDNSTCATCNNSAIQCVLSCNSDCKECATDGTCTDCADGKYLSSGQCLPCDNTLCATCSGSSQNCTQNCDIGCTTCTPTGACASCSEGEYFQTNQCFDCDNTVCATCENSAQECILECNLNCKECNTTGQCISCVDGKYLNNGQCLDCDNSVCATCEISNNNCNLDCNDSCNHCHPTGLCIDCFDGNYITNQQLCETCDFKCATCVTESDNCLQCSHETRDSANNCICKIGYYQIAQDIECSECSFKCESCTGNEDNCQTCYNVSRTGPPNCDCAVGYYDDKISGDCLQCKYDCACVEYEYCSYCLQSDGHLRNPLDCTCKQGYFSDDDGNCQKCNQKCQLCEGQADKCTVCKNISLRNTEIPNCQCKQGYYEHENSKQCLKCSPLCKSCDNAFKCTECLNSFMKLPFCFFYRGGFFSVTNDQDSSNVQICNTQCLACENSENNCTECTLGLNRSQVTPTCQCEPGFHDNNNTTQDCVQCPQLCSKCISENQCEECQEDSELNPYTFLCECKKGYKYDTNIQKCRECYHYTNNCHFTCPKNTIFDKKSKQCLNIAYSNQSNLILFCIGTIVIVASLFAAFTTKFAINNNKNKKLHKKEIANNLEDIKL